MFLTSVYVQLYISVECVECEGQRFKHLVIYHVMNKGTTTAGSEVKPRHPSVL